ncbi:MAG: hypothetical protein KDM91_12030 [Verrucomicrobiae bacterium]|nr:hypothetical protein [Verrucomicrobiae bacterium]
MNSKCQPIRRIGNPDESRFAERMAELENREFRHALTEERKRRRIAFCFALGATLLEAFLTVLPPLEPDSYLSEPYFFGAILWFGLLQLWHSTIPERKSGGLFETGRPMAESLAMETVLRLQAAALTLPILIALLIRIFLR